MIRARLYYIISDNSIISPIFSTYTEFYLQQKKYKYVVVVAF